MKPGIMAVVACAGATFTASAVAADCRLADTVPLRMYVTKPDDLFLPLAEPLAVPSYRLGEALTVKAGDIVLSRKVAMVGKLARFDADVAYRSRMPFSTDYTLKGGVDYPLLAISTTTRLHAIALKVSNGNDDYVFVDGNGALCEKPMVYEHWHEYLTYRAGRYTAAPELAAHLLSTEPAAVEAGADGDTILVDRIDAAAVDFSLRRTVHGKMGEAQKFSFDIHSKEVALGGYTLRLDAATPDSLTLAVVGEPALP